MIFHDIIMMKISHDKTCNVLLERIKDVFKRAIYEQIIIIMQIPLGKVMIEQRRIQWTKGENYIKLSYIVEW